MSTAREQSLIESARRWATALDEWKACRPPRRRNLIAAYQQRQHDRRDVLALEAAGIVESFDTLAPGERSRVADAIGYILWLAGDMHGRAQA